MNAGEQWGAFIIIPGKKRKGPYLIAKFDSNAEANEYARDWIGGGSMYVSPVDANAKPYDKAPRYKKLNTERLNGIKTGPKGNTANIRNRERKIGGSPFSGD